MRWLSRRLAPSSPTGDPTALCSSQFNQVLEALSSDTLPAERRIVGRVETLVELNRAPCYCCSSRTDASAILEPVPHTRDECSVTSRVAAFLQNWFRTNRIPSLMPPSWSTRWPGRTRTLGSNSPLPSASQRTSSRSMGESLSSASSSAKTTTRTLFGSLRR